MDVWRKGMEEEDLKPHRAERFDRASWTLVAAPPRTSFLASLFEEDLTGREVLCKFVRGNTHYFARSFLSGEGRDGPRRLRLDGDVFQGCRREHYRLAASPTIAITFSHGGERHNCGDISAGGLSILFDPKRHPEIREGAVLRDGLLRLRGIPHVIPALSVTVVQGDGSDGPARAGAVFLDLPRQIEEQIFVQVNAEARADAIRRKLLDKKTWGSP